MQPAQRVNSAGDGHRTVVVPFIPTAENLAKWAFDAVHRTSMAYGTAATGRRTAERRKSPVTWRPKLS